MAKNIDDLLARRPVDNARAEPHTQRMLAEVRACRLRDLRVRAGLT